MNSFHWFRRKAWKRHIRLLAFTIGCTLLAVTTLSVVFAQDSGKRPPGITPTPPVDITPTATIPPSGIPECPEELHNPNEWHPLFDPVLGCHFDHEHKHNPNDVADIFGPAGAWFGGTSISYPWETAHENMYKHEAYNWIVRRDIPSHGRSIWIKDFRWQIHATTAPFTLADGTLHGGYLGRYHSYSLEAQTCNSAGACGIVRTGGWIDFGHLEINNIDKCVFLPSDPSQQETCDNLGRRRIHYYYTGTAMPPSNATFFWYGRAGLLNGPNPELHPVQLAVSVNDGSVNVVPDDLYSLNFFCPNWDCGLNNSTMQAHSLGFSVHKKFDLDNDGLGNFTGFTDRYGDMVEGCSQVSLDCVPLILTNAPLGHVQHRDDRDLGLTTGMLPDFDTSPPGEWWIQYPEKPMEPMPGDTPEPTPEVTPEATPQPTRGLPDTPSHDSIGAPSQDDTGSGKQ